MVARSDVVVDWGHADRFWDVSLASGAHPAIGSISVHVEDDGKVTLNHGYETNGASGRFEAKLFATHRAAIVAGILEKVSDDPEYSAFRLANAPAGDTPKPGVDAWFSAKVRILEAAPLIAYATVIRGEDMANEMVEDILKEALFNPRTPPVESGYEIVAMDAERSGDDTYVVRVEATIHDADALAAAARESYGKSWGDEWTPEHMGEVLYEELLASNANPGPVEIGFEIVDRDWGGMAVPDVEAPAPR